MNKVTSLQDAIHRFVRGGARIYVAGFSHLIAFAAAHEIIRQKIRSLDLIRATPDMVYDQMVAAGCARRLVLSWAGNPGVGMLRAIRRSVESGAIELEEYTHHQMVGALRAGATGMPFYLLVAGSGGDLLDHNPNLTRLDCPFTSKQLVAVKAIRPDVAIVHAHRADEEGNTQIWGITGDAGGAAFAAHHVIATVEEIVDTSVVRRDPNRTLIPGSIVDAVVHVPCGAHPSFVQGCYDRDNAQYQAWNEISKEPAKVDAYLEEWVHSIPDRDAYVSKLGARVEELRSIPHLSEPVSYGTT